MNLIQLKHAGRLLSLGQLRKLDVWLHDLISRAEKDSRVEKPSSRKHILTEQTLDNKRIRPHVKMSGTSYRVDETYILRREVM